MALWNNGKLISTHVEAVYSLLYRDVLRRYRLLVCLSVLLHLGFHLRRLVFVFVPDEVIHILQASDIEIPSRVLRFPTCLVSLPSSVDVRLPL